MAETITINKAFEIICSKVEAALVPQGFAKQKVDNSSSDEMVALFTGESTAYSIVYYKDKMHMVMRSCVMTEDGPDNDWKSLATWMYDPTQDSTKEAESIGNDFCENVTSPTAIKRVRQTKKKKGDDEGNADPMFLAKRFVQFFPELKDEIRDEDDCYYPFRGATFTKTSIVPKIEYFLPRATQKEIDKLSQMLSTQYQNGDADTRAIITIIILNSIDPKFHEALKISMHKDLIEQWEAAQKFKGKNVKPEKKKKTKLSMAERLSQ